MSIYKTNNSISMILADMTPTLVICKMPNSHYLIIFRICAFKNLIK